MRLRPLRPDSTECPAGIPFIGSFESTYRPAHDVDVAETTEHIERFEHDLDLVQPCGISRLRYPVRWHRIEAAPGESDWRGTDAVMDRLRERGLTPIVDFVHHTSYPRWLTDGFGDGRFPAAYPATSRRWPGATDGSRSTRCSTSPSRHSCCAVITHRRSGPAVSADSDAAQRRRARRGRRGPSPPPTGSPRRSPGRWAVARPPLSPAAGEPGHRPTGSRSSPGSWSAHDRRRSCTRRPSHRRS